MEAANHVGSGAHPCPAPAPVQPITSIGTLGRHLARRLVEIGVRDVFSVPGDFNLALLDHLIAEPELNLVGCCNELNAGYAADGYARAKGVGACVVTFTVGGLSVINAIAGAYSENLPVICIVGGPNSNDYGTNRILHHTIGLPDFTQELRCFQTVTCTQAVVNNLDDAHEQIDTAISTALKESKPVYISISCNLPGIPHSTFAREPVPFSLAPNASNQLGLEAAVEATVEFLHKAVKPVLVGGPKLRVAKALKAFVEVADASGHAYSYYVLCVLPESVLLVKCLIWVGTYGLVYICLACSLQFLFPFFGIVRLCPLQNGNLLSFLLFLYHPQSESIKSLLWNFGLVIKSDTQFTWTLFLVPVPAPIPTKQNFFHPCFGELWDPCPDPVVVLLLNLAMEFRAWTIIFLINNGGYTIEVEIHDGPYNVIKNWDYTGLVDAIHNGEGKCWTAKVRKEDELTEAIATATGAQKDSLCFIEVFVHKDDTSKELLEWGSRVASANGRPPNPQ
ncbi:hypothetical protein FH972_000581 [Carpinus fangiana]|uniref:pyruvate decarboxylase n=1 Tax=Carpinus fangiana TaxID=176857 RepID=A0A5N6QBR9_9ROSI|nr:hypothetical protein FH972_000581 [Carpinus fangiana]